MSSLKTLAKNWSMDHKERCKSMFNNYILSDVKFVVQASRKIGERDSKRSKMEIPAHKFLLSICSPVFYAMFCGEMAETKEHIDLPDCEYEGMLELLRYIYTDDVCLNGNNVMQVLYLAEKYMIPSLISECTEYIGKNLDLSNVFCVFKHAEQYGNKGLLWHCWDVIDKNTEEALKSNEVLSMDKSFLNQLVERNTLNIREVELFKAVDFWAKEECKRQKLQGNGPNKRKVLGEKIVKNIRFPIMKQSEFVDVVLESSILTQHETSNIMKCYSSLVTSESGFLNSERVGTFVRCSRFSSFLPTALYHDSDVLSERDWFPLEVDKEIILHGVSILGNDGGKFTVQLKIFVYDESDELVLLTKTGTFTSGRKAGNYGFYYGFDVIFDEPFVVGTEHCYFIETSVSGPGRCLGNEVIHEVEHSGVKIVFDHDGQRVINDPIHGELFGSMSAEILFKVKE